MRMRPAFVLLAALAVAPLPGAAQTSLPVGSVVPVSRVADVPAELVFSAPGAGFLTVVARASEDVSVAVADEEYQTLPDGAADADLGGDLGAEQLVVGIPRAGTYRVLVESLSGAAAALSVGASFLASDLACRPTDPDGSPSGAVQLQVGTSHLDAIDPASGDPWDWFAIAAREAGTLTILTRVEGDGDLRLERFQAGGYREAVDASDQDLDGVLGNESLTVDVEAGTTVYLRVAPVSGAGAVPYRLASGLIPR